MLQGTVLEPLLLLSYTNYLPDVVRSSHTKLFADDCLLFKSITTDRHQQALQSDLSSLEQWEKDFNPGKCTAIGVKPKQKKLARETSYAIHNKMLGTSDTSRYLGISITDNPTWSRHTAITTALPKSRPFPTPPWYGPLWNMLLLLGTPISRKTSAN